MEIDQTRRALDAFFGNPKEKVLFLKGPWGSGKSYFLREYLEQSDKVPVTQYFVSLFGLGTLGEVRECLNASLKFRSTKKRTRFGTWLNFLTGNAGQIPKVLDKLPTFYGVSASAIGASVFWLITRNQPSVMVFDDLERTKLGVDEILGLASSLAENSKAKIIVVFNEGELDQDKQGLLNKYREKLVDIELLFKPSTTDLVYHYLAEVDIRNEVAKLFDALSVCNIRLLLRINDHLKRFHSLMAENGVTLHADELLHAAKLVCLRYLSKLTLSPDHLRSMLFGIGKSTGGSTTPNEKEFDDLCEKLRMFPPYLFDDLFLELIQNGYCTEANIKKFLESQKDSVFAEEYRKDVRAAYSKYGDNFAGDLNGVFFDMEQFLDKYADKISTDEFLRHLSFLDKLNYSRPIDPWVVQHLKAVDKIKDPSVRIKAAQLLPNSALVTNYLSKLRESPAKRRNPLDIIRKVTKSRSWNVQDSRELDAMSEEEIYNWISESSEPDLIDELRSIRDIWRGAEENDRTSFSNKINAALRRLSQRSFLDRLRVKNLFGIE